MPPFILIPIAAIVFLAALTRKTGTGETMSKKFSTPRWNPSEELLAIAKRANVSYDGAPVWDGGKLLSGASFTPGARIVGEYIKRRFSGVSRIGGFDIRRNTATIGKKVERYSVHSTGRAIDVHIPVLSGDEPDTLTGDRIAEWAVRNAKEVGIQYLIWNRTYIRFSDGESGEYTATNPHVDHLHIEFNEKSGRRETPWHQTQPDIS